MQKRMLVLAGVAVLLFAGCGSEAGQNDVVADVADDVAGSDVPDVQINTDLGPDFIAADADVTGDVPVDVPTDVDLDANADTPWNYQEKWAVPAEEWSKCPATELIGGQTLAQKAAYYDWIVPKLHQVPVTAVGHEAYSTVYTINCTGDVPDEIVPDGDLPVCLHTLSENNGLWTGLYVASQAFRYATTGDAESLAQLRRTLNGTYQMLQITGKPGLFTRDMRDPTLPQQYCIEDEEPYASAATDNEKYARYVPPGEDMRGNQFLKVDTDGCFLTWDPTLNAGVGGWLKHPENCTDTRFAGFCWQANASKDEYSGHVFAAGIAAKLVPAEGEAADVHAMAVDILKKVGQHLVANKFWINDWDGRQTRFGSSYALSFDESPGSNAIQALDWIRVAATVTGDPELTATYKDCLLQMSGTLACIDREAEMLLPTDYRTYLDDMGLAMGCSSNYDTINIALLNYFNLIWFEGDSALRTFYRDKFRKNTKGPDGDGRDLWAEANPFMNMSLVSRMEPGQYDAAEVAKLIEDSVCTMKRFPTDNIRRARDASGYAEWCSSARHGSLAEAPVPIEERCSSIFEWWGDPNEREVCGTDLKSAEPPAGYLLPYWMGRYFGFITADM